MSLHELAAAGPARNARQRPATRLDFYTRRPDREPGRGRFVRHVGAPRLGVQGSFNEAHVLAIVQAVCELRAGGTAAGPLFLGMDTPRPLRTGVRSALEVLPQTAWRR